MTYIPFAFGSTAGAVAAGNDRRFNTSIFDATTYGASVWDSTHDVSPSIALAIAAATAAGGGIVQVPPGTYGIASTINLAVPGVVLQGAGHCRGINPATTLKWIGGPGGTLVRIGTTTAVWGMGLDGIFLHCNPTDATLGKANKGCVITNAWGLLLDVYVYEPMVFGTLQPVAIDIGEGCNLGRYPYLGWTMQMSPPTTGVAVTPIGTYTRPGFPVGLWIHSNTSTNTNYNSSYTRIDFINATSTVGLPVLIDWSDHLDFGIIDIYMGATGSASLIGYGLVINNAVTNTLLTTSVAASATTTLTFASTTSTLANAPPIALGWTVSGTGIAGSPTVVSTTSTTVTLSVAQTIASGTVVKFTNINGPLSPAGTSIHNYSANYAVSIPGQITASGVIPATGTTIDKYDIFNGPPVPVIGAGATVKWADDNATQFRIKAGNTTYLSNNPYYAGQIEAYNAVAATLNDTPLVLGMYLGGQGYAVLTPDGPTAGWWSCGTVKNATGNYDLAFSHNIFTIGDVILPSIKLGSVQITGYGNRVQTHGGIDFSSSSVASVTTDISNHVDLYGGVYGFGVSPYSLNYLADSGSVHNFLVNKISVGTIDATGLTLVGKISIGGIATLPIANITTATLGSATISSGTLSGLVGYVSRVWDSGAIVASSTYTMVYRSPFAFTITSMDSICTTGTFTVSVQIGGVSVTGLAAINVTSSQLNSTATAARAVAANTLVTLVVTAATGSPTGATINLNTVRV